MIQDWSCKRMVRQASFLHVLYKSANGAPCKTIKNLQQEICKAPLNLKKNYSKRNTRCYRLIIAGHMKSRKNVLKGKYAHSCPRGICI